VSTTETGPPDASWPSAAPGTPGLKLGFPGAHEAATPARRFSHRAIVALLVVALGSLAFIGITVLATPGPAPYCNPLKCQGPPIGHPGERGAASQSAVGAAVESGTLYRNAQGFSLRYQPEPSVKTTADGIQLNYSFNTVGNGFLDVFGFPAGSSSDESLVQNLISQNFPNAQAVYQMPNPLIGYHPAFGEAFNIAPASSDGTTQTSRALVAAATYNGFAIVVITLGPLLPIVNTASQFYNAHPSPANVYMAYFYGTDSLLNSIQFPS
jgi:hypothetical protein